MKNKSLLKRIEAHPKILFLIDGIGALMTAILLGFVLPKFESFFGIPKSMLHLLALIPVLYVLYDIACYLKENLESSKYLKGIAILNLMYCCLSLGLATYHRELLTIWGWVYVINEIIIIIALSIFELNVAHKHASK